MMTSRLRGSGLVTGRRPDASDRDRCSENKTAKWDQTPKTKQMPPLRAPRNENPPASVRQDMEAPG